MQAWTVAVAVAVSIIEIVTIIYQHQLNQMLSYSNKNPTIIINQTWSMVVTLTTVSAWIIKITIYIPPSHLVLYIQHILIPHQDYQCFITPSWWIPPIILLDNHHYPLVHHHHHHHLSIINSISISNNLWRAVVVVLITNQLHNISISLYSIRSNNVYRDVDYHDRAYGDDECDHIDYSVSVICIHSMRIG